MNDCSQQTAFSGLEQVGSDLDEIGQAQVDASSFLQDFHVADGDVWHDGQHQRLDHLVETVGKALGPGHLMTHSGENM